MNIPQQSKVDYLCPTCNSKLLYDAHAQWDTETQSFQLQEVFEYAWCSTCDCPVTVTATNANHLLRLA
jgi:hypothetical protein